MNYVLLNFGTPESKCAAVYLDSIAAKDDEIHSLYMDFGLPNRVKAMSSARAIAEQYCTTHGVMDSKMVIDGINFTPVHYDMNTNQYIPKSLITDNTENKIFSPRLFQYPLYRQKTILEAMCYARIAVNATKVVAVHRKITQEQLDAINDMFNFLPAQVQPTQTIECIMPFIGMNLSEMVSSVSLTTDDMKDTVYCSQKIPCGKCGACFKMEELLYAEQKSH